MEIAKIPCQIKIQSPKSDKEFFLWNAKKIKIEKRTIVPQYNQREVWWCSLGVNIGHEEDGKNEEFERPVLILKKFNKNIFIGLPMTSTNKNLPFYFPYSIHDRRGSVILSQPRILSSRRLNRRISKIRSKLFKHVRDKFTRLIQ